MNAHARHLDLVQAVIAAGHVSIRLAELPPGLRGAVDHDDPRHPIIYLARDLAPDVMADELSDRLAHVRDLDRAHRRRGIAPCSELVGDDTFLEAAVGDDSSELAARQWRRTFGVVRAL